MRQLASLRGVITESYHVYKHRRVSILAAAIAYYAFISFIPLLLLFLSIGSLLGEEALTTYILRETGPLLTPTAEDMISNMIRSTAGRNSATVLGSVVFLWTGLKLFRGIDIVFSEIYQVQEIESLGRQLIDAIVILASIGGAIVVVIIMGGLLPNIMRSLFGDIVIEFGVILGLLIVLMPIYYYAPDTDVTYREIIPGAVIGAVGWTLLVDGFALYVANADQYELYGVIGGILLFIIWLYFGATIIIVGGIVNAVLSGRTNSESGTEVDVDDDHEPSEGVPDIVELASRIKTIQERVEENTVEKSLLKQELRSYIDSRIRKGHATGWGPYLILLYGTAMTLGAFWWLSGGWAILAMIIIWLSTLGLYALMIFIGIGINTVRVPGRILRWIRNR